jgi:hypothetical protein
MLAAKGRLRVAPRGCALPLTSTPRGAPQLSGRDMA